jgi:hypothetical protein
VSSDSLDSGLLDGLDELPARAGELLAGLTGDRSACQSTGQVRTPIQAQWRGDSREVAKTRLFKYVRRAPEGTPLSKIVADVFGQDAVDSAGADYQLARRFFDGCNLFKIARRDGNLWVEPATEAFHLSTQYANLQNARQRGDGLSDGSETGSTAQQGGDRADCPTDTEAGDSRQYPKDRAQSILDKRVRLDGRNGQDYRAGLLRQLGIEREIQQDKFKILSRVRGSGPEHLLIPYLTRFNDADRAGDTQDRFRTALRTAAERYQDAVVLTLTLDEKRFSSVSEALDGFTGAKRNFLSWLDYQVGGSRPDNLTVLEWTAGGLPHVHLVLFGISWLMPQSKIAAKWDSLGIARNVWVTDAHSRDGSDKWRLHDDDGRPVTLRYYLGKAIRGLQRVAESDAGQLREAVEDGDISLWRHALYWATGRQYCSCSRSLKDSGDSDGLPHVKRYEFVGVAQYRDIPAHIRRDAAILDRPPPPSRQSGVSTGSGQSISSTASTAGD